MTTNQVTSEEIMKRLQTVIDPELHVDIVSLGLIYDATVTKKQLPDGEKQHVHIIMTLTTPGCPLAGMFDQMLRDSLYDLEDVLDIDQDVSIELTFDPPWVPDMMSEEAKAELGFD